jgi:hypothetical protein
MNRSGFGKNLLNVQKKCFDCRFQWDDGDFNVDEVGILLNYELRNFLFLLDYLA